METKTELNATQNKILEMLLTNTGRALCDSGDAYGRNWERNQAKGVEGIVNAPAGVISEWGFSLSTFHLLSEHCTYAAELDQAFSAFDASRYAMGVNDSWSETVDAWLDTLGVPVDGDFYSDARNEFNTYNFEYWLGDQTLQFTKFGLNGSSYVALQIHQGADFRGGYTKPVIFECDTEGLIFGGQQFGAICQNCELGFEYCGGNGLEITREPENPTAAFLELPADSIAPILFEGKCPNCGSMQFIV